MRPTVSRSMAPGSHVQPSEARSGVHRATAGRPAPVRRCPLTSRTVLLIAATVIGGTSLFGGRGNVVWTLFGVLFVKLLDNSLNLLNLSFFTITMVKGSVILFAALLDATRVRLQNLQP